MKIPELRPMHEPLLSLLDSAERARAACYGDRAGCRLFVASRAVQRVLAGHYLCREPATVVIDRSCLHCGDDRHGRPRIAGEQNGRDGLDFSVTHSGPLLVLAFVSRGLVGVDAEATDRDLGTGRLIDSVLTQAESALVAAAPEADRTWAFCRLWTRKEALLKLTGRGLAVPLRSVDVTAELPGVPGGRPGDPVRLTDLRLHGIAPAYAVAVATTDPARRMIVRSATPFLVERPGTHVITASVKPIM